MNELNRKFSIFLNKSERDFIYDSIKKIKGQERAIIWQLIRKRLRIVIAIFLTLVVSIFFYIFTQKNKSRNLLEIVRLNWQENNWQKIADSYHQILDIGFEDDSVLADIKTLTSTYIYRNNVDSINPILTVLARYPLDQKDAKLVHGEIAFLYALSNNYKKANSILNLYLNKKHVNRYGNRSAIELDINTIYGETFLYELHTKYFPSMIFIQNQDSSKNKDLGFHFGKHEVTNQQFVVFLNTYKSRIVKSGEYIGEEIILEQADFIKMQNGNFYVVEGFEKHPVMTTWYGAKAYCDWMGGRLPKVSEWIFTAKGGDDPEPFIYSGSDTLETIAWYLENSNGNPHSVGQKRPNKLGIFDMTGNLYEWTLEGNEEIRIAMGGACYNSPNSSDPSKNHLKITTEFPNPASYHMYMGFRVLIDTK